MRTGGRAHLDLRRHGSFRAMQQQDRFLESYHGEQEARWRGGQRRRHQKLTADGLRATLKAIDAPAAVFEHQGLVP
jgi:hypothetical protein